MITFKDTSDVSLIQYVGNDSMVCAAAKVSTTGEEARNLVDDDANYGLINYLMKHRHGCYDEETDVLTKDGWKNWKEITGEEEFCTLNPHTNIIEYQKATNTNLGVEYHGRMYSIDTNNINLLVNEDHAMYACIMTTKSGREKNTYNFYQAKELNDVNHCYLKTGTWFCSENKLSENELKLLGFAIGDGSLNNKTLEFHLTKDRKINFLQNLCKNLNIELKNNKNKYYIKWPFNFSIYNDKKEKIIPKDILSTHNSSYLKSLFDGLINSDGSITKEGKITYTTTSHILAGQIQELALKIGQAANFSVNKNRLSSYGDKPIYILNILSENFKPEINRTTKQSLWIENWSGKIYCVTVPNHTLYVRRNGKTVWSGNTPFEHGVMTFFVNAPIFVWREWHRHRIAFSYSEESGRYKELSPVFYLPPKDRPMFKIDNWKPGRPKFTKIESSEEENLYDKLCENLSTSYEIGYKSYIDNLSLGIDPGLARDCLPVGIFSSCWVSCNPRSMMAFLSLRTHYPDAKFVSYPLYEIEIAAQKIEKIFSELYPLTYRAFCENGRVGP